MNSNLYLNVDQLHQLLKCIQSENPKWAELITEIVDLTYDLKWVEVKKI